MSLSFLNARRAMISGYTVLLQLVWRCAYGQVVLVLTCLYGVVIVYALYPCIALLDEFDWLSSIVGLILLRQQSSCSCRLCIGRCPVNHGYELFSCSWLFLAGLVLPSLRQWCCLGWTLGIWTGRRQYSVFCPQPKTVSFSLILVSLGLSSWCRHLSKIPTSGLWSVHMSKFGSPRR